MGARAVQVTKSIGAAPDDDQDSLAKEGQCAYDHSG